MSISRIVKAGRVAVISLGLSSCSSSDGVSDVAPAGFGFFDCPHVSKGEPLSAKATMGDAEIFIAIRVSGSTVFNGSAVPWASVPEVIDFMGAALEDVSLSGDQTVVNVSASLDTADTKSGSFTLRGTFQDGCGMVRTFNFIIGENHVEVATLEPAMPKAALGRAA